MLWLVEPLFEGVWVIMNTMKSPPLHTWTPVLESIPLSQAMGATVLLKMECYQPTGSFKIRGIGQLCQAMVATGKKHLVSSSGGNAGYAVAYAGRKLGVDVSVFVPTTTHPIFIEAIKSEGAAVNVEGRVWDEANEAAKEYVEAIDGGFIPPFDHSTIWAGHSTLVDELVTQCEKPDAIVVSVGGGGLASGILQGLHRHEWKDVLLFTVETNGAASLAASIKENKLITLPTVDTVATSLAAKCVAKEMWTWTKKHPITPLTVSDKASILACRRFVDDHRVLVEPACGAALSVVYDQRPELAAAKSIVLIVCGGIGISVDLLGEYMRRYVA